MKIGQYGIFFKIARVSWFQSLKSVEPPTSKEESFDKKVCRVVQYIYSDAIRRKPWQYGYVGKSPIFDQNVTNDPFIFDYRIKFNNLRCSLILFCTCANEKYVILPSMKCAGTKKIFCCTKETISLKCSCNKDFRNVLLNKS